MGNSIVHPTSLWSLPMDAERFDALARSLIALRTRRGTLGLVLGGTLGLLGLAESEADKRRNNRRQLQHRREVQSEKTGRRGKRGKRGKRRKKNSRCPAGDSTCPAHTKL